MKALLITIAVASLTLSSFPAWPCEEHQKQHSKAETVETKGDLCPTCGMPHHGKAFTKHKGEKYGFCCKDCRDKFLKNPDKYLKETK